MHWKSAENSTDGNLKLINLPVSFSSSISISGGMSASIHSSELQVTQTVFSLTDIWNVIGSECQKQH